MKKALRIGYHQYYNDRLFDKHLAYVKANLSVIDEITLFAEFSHYGYWALESEEKNAELIKERIARYREAGVKSVGINILCTIGHLEEGFDVLPRAPFPYMVNEKGIASSACLCPANERFLDYVSKRYALYAKTGANFIWMDDDLRVKSHGVANNFCFCDGCIAEFNRDNSTVFTRQELAEQIKSNQNISSAWENRTDKVMKKLFETIKAAVKTTNPDVEIGYMTACGNGKTEWILASGASKLRPGGGHYKDDIPLEIFEKSFAMQSDILNAPDYIKDIQYEYEAFNYQTMERSKKLSELETTLALMSGCNGALYNDDIFYDREQTTDMLKECAKKWDLLTKLNKSALPYGVYCNDAAIARFFSEIGIPMTLYTENAVAAVVLGRNMKKMPPEELEKVLALNLFTDGEGVEILYSNGFETCCGGKIKVMYENGMAERFGSHPVNGEFKDYYRDIFMNFKYIYEHNGKAYEFEPLPEAETISNLETITHIPLGCSLYRYENGRNMKFAADGYLFPQSIKSAAKKEQLGNLLDWLSGERLPLRIKKAVKLIPMVTRDELDNFTIMITNASFDPSGSFECVLRSEKTFYLINKNGELLTIPQISQNGETIISFENIQPWDYVLITNKVSSPHPKI